MDIIAAHVDGAREAFQVDSRVLFNDQAGQPVYAHGSFIYLLDEMGHLQGLLPPIVSAERLAAIVRQLE